MTKLNKKAGEKILSIWWFLCLVLVGAIVVIVVATSFGAMVDTRDKESMMLQEKIMDCISENGYLREEVLKLGTEEIFDFCNLNKNQFTDNGLILFNLTIYNESQQIMKSFLHGQISYQEDCIVVAGKKAENFPFCIQSKEKLIYFNKKTATKESWSIYLLVASNNYGYKESILKKGETK